MNRGLCPKFLGCVVSGLLKYLQNRLYVRKGHRGFFTFGGELAENDC